MQKFIYRTNEPESAGSKTVIELALVKKSINMKIKVLLFAIVLLGLGACTQKTCPTYSDAQPAQEEVQQEVKADRM